MVSPQENRLVHPGLLASGALMLRALESICYKWHNMTSADVLKPLFWVGSALEEVRSFPVGVRRQVGFALYLAQTGGKHMDAKPLKGFGGAGVLELVEDHDGNTYRAVYTVKLAGALYALHITESG